MPQYSHKYANRALRLLLTILTLITTPAHVILAQSSYTPTPPYDFALVYHKLAGSTPAFKVIARNMPAYDEAEEREKSKILAKISQRLRRRFNNLEVHQKLLTIRTRIRMDVQRQPQKDKASLQLKLPSNSPLYFPMQPGKRNIAVLMQDFKRFRTIPLNPLQANYVESRAAPDEDIIMYLQLQAVDADAEKPLKLDSIKQWPLLTRIARMGLYTQDNETIWEYKAPWLTTEQGNAVRKLFRK